MAKYKPSQRLRKRRTRAHVIADLSINLIERCALERGFAVERFRADYGIDLTFSGLSGLSRHGRGKVTRAADSWH